MSTEGERIRVVFMGTPEFSADILEELAMREEVVCVYTRPDKVRSRGSKTESSPVKVCAEKLGIPVRCLSSFKDPGDVQALAALAPDVICVAAFGVILPKEVLDIPPWGCINVHASILPRWRGAAPVERAILAGDEEAGVCIMRMEEGLDTGAFCICRRMPLSDLSASEVTSELALMGARALVSALEQMRRGDVRWTAQDESLVTYAHKIGKHELFLDPDHDALANARRVRASSKAHPAKCIIGGRSVTVVAACVAKDGAEAALSAGEVRFAQGELLLGCAEGTLCVITVKPDGKREMPATDFAQGLKGARAGIPWTALR